LRWAPPTSLQPALASGVFLVTFEGASAGDVAAASGSQHATTTNT